MLRSKFLIFALLFLIGCQISPRNIEYGEDMCTFCKMTVIDQRHAAQLVTKKGRIYVFDAIECMVQYKKENTQTYNYQLVTDYLSPGSLVPVDEATFMVSREIPSPMGAYLSAFADTDQLKALPEAANGKIYDWASLQTVIPGK